MIIKLAIVGTAQPHQESAAEKLKHSPGLIIYHGLGSGKSFTSLLAGENTKGNKLVLPPAALQGNYAKEMDKFKVKHPDYKVMSMETFRKNPDRYIEKHKPELVIADEVHRARTEGSVTLSALQQNRHKFKKFLGLTGSPISNDPSDVAPLINLAAGANVFPDAKKFHERYVFERPKKVGLFGRILGVKGGTVGEPRNMAEFKAKASPFIHSFSGSKEYAKHIPSVRSETVHVPMDKEQKDYYDFAMGKLPAWSRYKISHNLPPTKSEAVKLNAFFSAARQISNTPHSFGGHEGSPKLNRILHDIEHGIKHDPNFKSVTYSNYLNSGLNDIGQLLDKRKIKYGRFTGEESAEVRDAAIRSFNSGKLRHLLVSPAGAEGLDLKGAKLLQIADPHWNPERTKQVIGRTARFKSHESLPLAERNVLVKQYLSEPPKTLMTKIKSWFSPLPLHQMGVDQYIANRSEEKAQLNEAFLNTLKEIK